MFALFTGLMATGLSVLMRLELSGPGVQYIADNQLYNSIVTGHGILMMFFVIIPALVGGFGNYLLPLLVGGPDMAKESGPIVLGEKSIYTNRRGESKKNKNSLGGYLAGLFEGDGHI
jgi:hypothetical protein